MGGLLTPEYVYFHLHVVPIFRAGFLFILIVHSLTIAWIAVHAKEGYLYSDGLYLVLYTITTVGYGDEIVLSIRGRLFLCGLFIVGALVNGIVISQMSVFLAKADIETERKDKLRETLAVLKHFNIPHAVQSEILSFQQHTLEHNLGSSHESLVASLPTSIQDSLALFMKIKYISMVPMFSTASHDCKIALANSLVNIVFRPQEFIIIAGETGKEMYFLGHGTADVIHPQGNYLATLRKGNFFGEIALIVEEAKRTASVKALTYCDIFRLEKQDFSVILRKFPAFKDSVQQQMEDRVKQFLVQNANAIAIVPKRVKKVAPLVSGGPAPPSPTHGDALSKSQSNTTHERPESPVGRGTFKRRQSRADIQIALNDSLKEAVIQTGKIAKRREGGHTNLSEGGGLSDAGDDLFGDEGFVTSMRLDSAQAQRMKKEARNFQDGLIRTTSAGDLNRVTSWKSGEAPSHDVVTRLTERVAELELLSRANAGRNSGVGLPPGTVSS